MTRTIVPPFASSSRHWQELPDTKIILMTGYTGEANRRLAFLGGADGFLDKTTLVIDLLPAIRDIVDSMR
jgi:CheY-like chemotaxis protein